MKSDPGVTLRQVLSISQLLLGAVFKPKTTEFASQVDIYQT